jgi:hypothetical protein
VVYYLFFASHNRVAAGKIAEDIVNKYKDRRA